MHIGFKAMDDTNGIAGRPMTQICRPDRVNEPERIGNIHMQFGLMKGNSRSGTTCKRTFASWWSKPDWRIA
jgi:hypothetical protein